MKNQKMYEADDKMISIIRDNYNILQSLGSFGINLGFGDKTVREVCDEQNVDTYTFLAVVNFTINGVSDCNPVVYNFTISPSAFQANLEEEYHVLCSGSSTSHNPMAGVTSPTSTINWYDAPTGGTLLSSSYTFSTPVLTNASSTPIEYLYYFFC